MPWSHRACLYNFVHCANVNRVSPPCPMLKYSFAFLFHMENYSLWNREIHFLQTFWKGYPKWKEILWYENVKNHQIFFPKFKYFHNFFKYFWKNFVVSFISFAVCFLFGLYKKYFFSPTLLTSQSTSSHPMSKPQISKSQIQRKNYYQPPPTSNHHTTSTSYNFKGLSGSRWFI